MLLLFLYVILINVPGSFIPHTYTLYILLNQGVAYASNGSVYFNTAAFTKAGHTYGKLMPEQIGNSDLLAEGEGRYRYNTIDVVCLP